MNKSLIITLDSSEEPLLSRELGTFVCEKLKDGEISSRVVNPKNILVNKEITIKISGDSKSVNAFQKYSSFKFREFLEPDI